MGYLTIKLGQDVRMTDELLAVDVREAARRLSVAPRTITTLVSSGELKSRKIGRRRVIPVRALEEFLRRDHPTAKSTSASEEAATK